MLENIFCALIAVFAVWGVIGAVYAAALAVLSPKKSEKAVITVFAHGESCVTDISLILSRLSVTGDIKRCVVAAVCEDGDLETASALECAFGNEKRVVICSREGFYKRFLSESTMNGSRKAI
ncbi:MAG: hypothetical protein IJS90_04845 [Clostridia bacterium]|nr:hypothetical protein [Clostridia bacterium]